MQRATGVWSSPGSKIMCFISWAVMSSTPLRAAFAMECCHIMSHPNVAKMTLFKAYVLKGSWELVVSNRSILQLLRGNHFAVGRSGILGSLSGSSDDEL